MSKVSVFATSLAVGLSFIAISCMGPNYKPPAGAAAPATGGSTVAPILASAGIPGKPAAPGAATPAGSAAAATPAAGAIVATVPAVAVSPWAGSEMFFAASLFGFVVLGISVYLFRGKPTPTEG